MRTNEFIREELHLITISFLTSTTAILSLHVTQVSGQITPITSSPQRGVVLACLIIEYLQRSICCYCLEQTLDGLDQKYLLTEITDKSLFMGGKTLYETLCITDKSMVDNVNRYRTSRNEYKDYIEMWVHEIKTSFAASKLIISNNPSEVTLSLQGETEKVEGLAEQALSYVRSTNPEKDHITKEPSLQECVSKVIRKHSKSFIYQKVKVQSDDLGLPVCSDSKWLEFILDQITSNALKYAPKEAGTIHIWTASTGNMISLRIQNNESGISSSELGRIFEKGFTGISSRLNEKVIGTGLYLCKTLCNKLYLGIRMESVQGQGTTIILDFPISRLMLLK